MVEEKKILKVRLSLKGRPVKTYSFDKDVVTVGRSPDCDISLDNTGISREHMRIEITPDGHYNAIDLGSANGTVLNDKPLARAYLSHDDHIQIGKFTLWIGIDTDRRGESRRSRLESDASKFENTTVMSTEELNYVRSRAREEELAPERAGYGYKRSTSVRARSRPTFIAAILIAFILGTATGAGSMWYLAHHPIQAIQRDR